VQPDATITATPFVYLTFSPGSVVPRPSAVNVGRSRSPTPGSPQPQDVTTILSSLSANDPSESWLIVTHIGKDCPKQMQSTATTVNARRVGLPGRLRIL
jgi:hypothetical protein